jgi:DNA polymerase-3 subunit delta'
VEAGHLGDQAANAFLKTLEEPPAHAVFILLAANPSAVLPTILSRCQQLALPGAVAVARRMSEDVSLPELAATTLTDGGLEGAVNNIRSALEAGTNGETRDLLRLPYALPDGVPPFASVAAVALEMATEAEADPAGEELARLASDLMEVERRSRALNLNSRGQMVSCLMRWYREL